MPVRTRVETRKARNYVDGLRVDIEESQTAFLDKKADEAQENFLSRIQEQAPARRGAWAGWSKNVANNERARRWWFANIGFGRVTTNTKLLTDGRHYIRTGRITKIWDFVTSFKGGVFTLLIKANKTAIDSEGRFKYRWVLGSFDQRTGSRWQIPGHKATGWPLINTITTEVFEQFKESLDDFNEVVRGVIRNR